MMGYKPMPLQAQGVPQRPQAPMGQVGFVPRQSPINPAAMSQMGQNIGMGMQGGRDAMRQRMMQQYMGPQSQAGWALGTRTMPTQAQGTPNMWQQLISRFGGGQR